MILEALRVEKTATIPENLRDAVEYLIKSGEVTNINLSVGLQELRARLSTSFIDMKALLDHVEQDKLRKEDEEIQARALMNQPRRRLNLASHSGTSSAPTAPVVAQAKCPCGNHYPKQCVYRRCGMCCNGCLRHKHRDPQVGLARMAGRGF